MISFSTISCGSDWSGSDWTVTDEKELALLIARVALGQYSHVLKILSATGNLAYAPSQNAIDGAIKKLTPAHYDHPWQRDGWVFQVIAWITANLQAPDDPKAPPHIRLADKGFDGLHLKLNEHNDVELVVICEEKATTNPRNTIRDKVWPEFIGFEQGLREPELVSEATTLLMLCKHPDPEKAIADIFWDDTRSYRVSITIAEKENSTAGRKELFKGYETVVTGNNVKRRRAETFYSADIRKWIDTLSSASINLLKQMPAKSNV